jgi:hypothetical protein
MERALARVAAQQQGTHPAGASADHARTAAALRAASSLVRERERASERE